MLPHKHFMVAAIAIAPVAYIMSPAKGLSDVMRWVVAGGLVSVAVDFDVLALVMIKGGKTDTLRPFKNPLNIVRQFDRFMDALAATGVLRTAMATHAVISLALVAVFYLYGGDYFIPALLGVLTHLATDIPNMKRAFN